MGSQNPETGAGFNYDDETSSGEPTPTPDRSEIVSAEEVVASEGVPQLEDYDTVAAHEDALEGYEIRLNEAKALDKELSYGAPDTSIFKMPSDEKLKKFAEATKGLGQEKQQVIKGQGPSGYGLPGRGSSYSPIMQSPYAPYKTTLRGPRTSDLESLLMNSIKTSSQMRLANFQGPRIRGLFG